MNYHAVYILAFLLVTSCTTNDDIANIVLAIDNDIEAELFEHLSSGVNEISLMLTTTEVVTCEESAFDYKINDTGNKLIITLIGITRPLNCDESIEGRVQTLIPLNRTKDGRYPLEVEILNAFENNGSVAIGSDAYNLKLEAKRGFNISRANLIKTPKNIIWGYLQGDDINILSTLKENFVKSIENNVATTSLKEGNYSHFEIGNNSLIQVKEANSSYVINAFYFELIGEKELVKSKTEEYRLTLGSDVTLKIFTGEGDIF